MWSGCNKCNNYNSNSCTDIISTDCIKWEGEPYSDLDICINDTLTEVTTIILDIVLQNGDDQISQEEYRGDIVNITDINVQYIDDVCKELILICPVNIGSIGGRIIIS